MMKSNFDADSVLFVTVLVSCLVALCIVTVSHGKVEVEDIVEKIDELYRSETSYTEMEMTIETPHWKRTLSLEAWSRGMDKTFIVINSPKKEKGTATLRIGNEMWNYFPRTDKVMKVPPSMMMGSWMGSDFTNDDLVKESSMLEDYEFEMITPENPQEELLYVKLVPKEDTPIVWGKIILAVRESDYLPVWEKYYDEKGNLMRIMGFEDIEELGGKIIPTTIILTPQTKEGHTTTVSYRKAKFDIPLKDDIFTMRNLQTPGRYSR
jgi:outer membrane lipoprotein-sorting protein